MPRRWILSMVTLRRTPDVWRVSVRSGKDQQPLAIITLAPGVQEPCTRDISLSARQKRYLMLPRVMKFSVATPCKSGKQRGPEQSKTCGWRGRGLAAQDDLKMVHELAAVRMLKSAVHVQLPKARTGWSVTLYRCLRRVAEIRSLPDAGDSGQIQHMVGGNGAKVIVAIIKIKMRQSSTMPTTVWWAISQSRPCPD